jgi:predicted phage terminase large subunit-like protein
MPSGSTSADSPTRNSLSGQQKSALRSMLAPEQRELIEELRRRGYSPQLKTTTDPTVSRPPAKSADLALARSQFQEFMTALYRGYDPQPFHVLLCQALDKVADGTIKRLLLQLPVRMGKSLHASTYFPAYFLGRNPDKRILHTSYREELLEGFSRIARDTIRGERGEDTYHEIFPDVHVDDASRAQARWDLAPPFKGGYSIGGVVSGITGKGADLFIVDDPVAGAEAARSDTQMANLWEWYTQDAYTRLEGDASVIIIGTRWAEHDLIGRTLEQAASDPLADQWHVLRFPALAEEDDILGRAPGEPLWPGKFDRDYLLKVRAQNVRAFEAIYQQNPAPPEGNIFKTEWWNYRYAQPASYRLIELHYDTAVKKGSRNDWTAMWAGGLTWDGRIHVLDIWWDKLEFPALVQRVKDDYATFAARGLRPTGIFIEDKASGSSLFQTLVETTHLPVGAILPEGDKEARAIAVTPFYSAGKVLHPAQHPRLADYFILMEKFPNTRIKDPVDASTQGVSHIMKQALTTDVGVAMAGGVRPQMVPPTTPSFILPNVAQPTPWMSGPRDLRRDYRIR